MSSASTAPSRVVWRALRLELLCVVGAGVLVAALQSEREEETRDRAERGSVVMGSGCPLAGRSERSREEETPAD